MPDESMRERVARAIAEADGCPIEALPIGEPLFIYREHAAAALRALREPTEAMVVQVCAYLNEFCGASGATAHGVKQILKLLIDAALGEGDVPPAA